MIFILKKDFQFDRMRRRMALGVRFKFRVFSFCLFVIIKEDVLMCFLNKTREIIQSIIDTSNNDDTDHFFLLLLLLLLTIKEQQQNQY